MQNNNFHISGGKKVEERNIYQDISQRTNGDIYIGVVGPANLLL